MRKVYSEERNGVLGTLLISFLGRWGWRVRPDIWLMNDVINLVSSTLFSRTSVFSFETPIRFGFSILVRDLVMIGDDWTITQTIGFRVSYHQYLTYTREPHFQTMMTFFKIWSGSRERPLKWNSTTGIFKFIRYMCMKKWIQSFLLYILVTLSVLRMGSAAIVCNY